MRSPSVREMQAPGQFAPPPPGGATSGYAAPDGTARTLSAYNLFVRAMTLKLKPENPELAQGELMKKVGDLWRALSHDEQRRWRADGDLGMAVPGASTWIANKAVSKPSAYQSFVRHMSANLKLQAPGSKQADNMRKIGELWRMMSPEDRARYEPANAPTPGNAMQVSYCTRRSCCPNALQPLDL